MALKNKLSKAFLDRLNQTRMKEMDKAYIAFFMKLVVSVWFVGMFVFGFYFVYSSLVYGSSEKIPINAMIAASIIQIILSLIMFLVGVKWYFNRRLPLARVFIINNAAGVLVGSILFHIVFNDSTVFALVNIHLFTTAMSICLGMLVSVVLLSFFSKPINSKKIEPSLNISFTLKIVPAFIFSILFFFMIVRGYSYQESMIHGLVFENSNRERDLTLITSAFGQLVSDVEKDTEMLTDLLGMARYSDVGASFLSRSQGHTDAVEHYLDFIFSERSTSGKYLEAVDIHIIEPRILFGRGYNNSANYIGVEFTKENIHLEPKIVLGNNNNQILSNIRDSRATFIDIKYIDVKVSSFTIYVPMIIDGNFVGIMSFRQSDNAITSIIDRVGLFDSDGDSSMKNVDIVMMSNDNRLLYAYNETFENINDYLALRSGSVNWDNFLSERYMFSSEGVNMSRLISFDEDGISFNLQKARPRNLDLNIVNIWQTVLFQNRHTSVSDFEISSIISIIALIIYSIAVYFLIRIHQNSLLKLGYSTSVLAQNGGDLRMRMKVNSNDESSILAYGINRFLEKISTVINTLKESISKMSMSFYEAGELISENYELSDKAVNEFENEIQIIEKVSGLISNASIVSSSQRKQFVSVNDSIGTLLETVTNINSSMENQATAINETSASIHEMMANISSVAASAQKVNQFSKELVSDAKNGSDIGEDVMEAIQHIKEASTQITDITRVIQLISEQTNLLAMNAAIEAAHAGEQGKGFAIVADKIRKLAEDTNENSKIISGIVQDVVDSVERTVVLAVQSSDAIEKILDSSTSVSSLIGEITNANSELDLGRRDILSVLKNLNQITFSVQNFSDEQTDISEKLNSQILSVDKLAVDVGYAVDSVNNETGELLKSIKSVSTLVLGSKDKINTLEVNMKGAQSVFSEISNLVNIFITDKDDEDSQNVEKKNN